MPDHEETTAAITAAFTDIARMAALAYTRATITYLMQQGRTREDAARAVASEARELFPTILPYFPDQSVGT